MSLALAVPLLTSVWWLAASVAKDGSTENESLVLRSSRVLASDNGTLYFTASDGVHGRELWKTDGTEAGSILVEDIVPGSRSSVPTLLASAGGMVFFAANDRIHGQELWVSDGSLLSTVMVKDINPGARGSKPAYFGLVAPYHSAALAVGDRLYFGAEAEGDSSLWTSDGTSAGTLRLGGGYPDELAAVGSTVFFATENELWRTDGTRSGTAYIRHFSGIGGLASLAGVGGRLFFSGNDHVHGNELWTSDGSRAGTVMVKDIYPGESGSYPSPIVNMHGTALFDAYGGSHPRLWMSDGTKKGTVSVSPPFHDLYLFDKQVIGSTLFFSGSANGTGHELWKSDGSKAGTVMVKDIDPGPGDSGAANYSRLAGSVFFSATNGTSGYELWTSDGTEAGTVIVKDTNPGEGSGAYPMSVVDGVLYLIGDDGLFGPELWKSDGTEEGTVMVKDIRPGAEGSGLTNPCPGLRRSC